MVKKICTDKMSFNECELAILRSAVENIEKKMGKEKIDNPEVSIIIGIVEDFIRKKKRICYGGTAINNILPEMEQFYDKDVELPDYDFFSPNPMKDAKLLADIYFRKGFKEVLTKAGIHEGTFKVYVNFFPVADITYLVPELYKNLLKKNIILGGVRYCPPNYLRMLMYLELSRPKGVPSRWEKVLKRLVILNKNYPLETKNCDVDDIQRIFESGYKGEDGGVSKENGFEKIFLISRQTLSTLGCIFFGAFANRLYLKNTKDLKRKPIPKIPDFDVLSLEPEKTAGILKERLEAENIKNVKVYKRKGLGDIIAPHYEVTIGRDTVAFIYEPLSCHSYNYHVIGGNQYKIATLDTMLSFYLAFLFTDRPYYNEKRIMCMSHYLFKVQEANRLKQKGILKRFSIECYGKQKTLEEIIESKSILRKKFNKNKNLKIKKRPYEWYFLKYVPSNKTVKNNLKKTIKKLKRKKRKKTKRLFNFL